ncbi:MAG: hypothetical protein OXE95_10930 [Chloroflexi bacterium]|nr:hypothetical protein [Chloroflexota bacterium]MCY4248071.1 hypothetical protein [Chloroflexota bacterium]
MTEKTTDAHTNFRNNQHGIMTIIGLVVTAAAGLLLRNDLLFGLVMGTIYLSSFRAGPRVAIAIAENAEESQAPAHIIGSIVAGIVSGVIAAVILFIVRSVVGDGINVTADDNIIVQIIKRFFDAWAWLPTGLGLAIGSLTYRAGAD